MSENTEIDSGEWKLHLNELEVEYYMKRTLFYNVVERYYRQSPYGDYVSEDEMIASLENLKNLRKQMQDVSKNHTCLTRYLVPVKPCRIARNETDSDYMQEYIDENY